MSNPRYAKYEYLEISVEQGIAYLVLNRPDKYNAVNLQMHYELANVWRDFDDDDEVNVILVSGKKVFCAGGDFEMTTAMTKDHQIHRKVYKDAHDLAMNMINCRKIIIAAVCKVAVGAGCCLALLSDIIITHDSARFRDGHIPIGVGAGDHALFSSWINAMGAPKAKYYLLTGEFINGALADKLNLVTMSLKNMEDVYDEAKKIAIKINNGPRYAIQDTKYSLNQFLRHNAIVGGNLSLSLEMLNFKEPHAKEGLAAIQEKRNPKFDKDSKL